MEHRLEGLQMEDDCRRTLEKGTEPSRHQVIRIDVLPDDVLLEFFDYCMDRNPLSKGKRDIEAWQSLVHVCQRWRNIVFGSPRRLNLRLYCRPNTPAMDTLDVWPALPLLIHGHIALSSGVDNIIVALGQTNRVCQVGLSGLARQLENVLAAMQVPFPELTELWFISHGGGTPPVAPDSFLGGSAPRLQYFQLWGIPFPTLPKLLLSATHLRRLDLSDIPHSGYISPEAMGALLSVLSSLQTLLLGFQSPQSSPDRESRRPPPPKRSVISTLTHFSFQGVIEYLDDLVTFIDAPQLNALFITFFFNQIDFDCPQLAQFISRTSKLRDWDAHVEFDDSTASVGLSSLFSKYSGIEISCKEPDWQLSSIAQVCSSCLPFLSRAEDLYIRHRYSQLVWKNDAIDNTLWLELLLPFPTVKNLYLSKDFAPGIAAALQEIVGTEVLPSLQNIFVEGLEPSGPFQEKIGQFVTARQRSGHPIAISVWEIYSDVDSDVDSDADS